ncbi:hypothetical protein NL676_019217 [Syzygium grande]|nr:hypothetical protein NL676_019217 [Syzygium grande]
MERAKPRGSHHPSLPFGPDPLCLSCGLLGARSLYALRGTPAPPSFPSPSLSAALAVRHGVRPTRPTSRRHVSAATCSLPAGEGARGFPGAMERWRGKGGRGKKFEDREGGEGGGPPPRLRWLPSGSRATFPAKSRRGGPLSRIPRQKKRWRPGDWARVASGDF